MDTNALHEEWDLAQRYEENCNSTPKGTKIIIQSSQKVETFSSLFNFPIHVNGHVQLNGMLDYGSMAISKNAEEKISSAGDLPVKKHSEGNIVLVG